MKDWLLYCLLCSLIYAMAAHAKVYDPNLTTAELILYTGERVPVRDCTLFMPNLGSETPSVVRNLKILGYNPQLSRQITIERIDFKDSNGNAVNEYETDFNSNVGYYGRYTILMSVKGYDIERSRKSVFILKLHRLGDTGPEVASSTHSGILSDRKFSVKDLPRCQPQKLSQKRN